MVQKREAKATNKLCVREILSLSFVCGAYFFEFRSRNIVCFVIAYNFNGKYAQGRHACALRFSRVPRSGVTYHRFATLENKTPALMHLSSASPRGGGPRADVGEYGDFVGTLRQISAFVVGEMWELRFCLTLGENVGTSLLFNREEIGNCRLFARSMARQSR